jgi:TatD DNase family protein
VATHRRYREAHEVICDSHAHLDHGDSFAPDLQEVLERARQAGVGCILNVATSPADAVATVETARQHAGILAAVGIHPHEAAAATDTALDEMSALTGDPKVVAWGEIGLDYHYMNAPREIQKDAFARQLSRAAASDLPVSVHSRDADEDIIQGITRHAGSRRGVIHCFTGDWAMATACLDAGFYLSFSGILTFASADTLRDVARRAPAHRILVETDSPYLAPAPRRGGRNEPARVTEVTDLLAELRGQTVQELAALTTRNFLDLFRQLPPQASHEPEHSQ